MNMLQRRFARAVPVLAALLAGCAYSVTVRHFGPEKLAQSESYRLSRVYLLVQVTPSYKPEKSAARKMLDLAESLAQEKSESLYTHRMSPEEIHEFGIRFAQAVKGSCEIIGFSVANGTAPPSWISDFTPDAVLYLEPSEFRVRQSVREVSVKVKEGEYRKEKRYNVSAGFSMKWRLVSEPERAVLFSGRYPVFGDVSVEEFSSAQDDLEEYLKPKFWSLAVQFMDTFKEDILPHEILRIRTVEKGKSDEMKQAYRELQNNNWDAAVSIWQDYSRKLTRESGPRYNLGIFWERQSKWSEALSEYKAALERAQKPSERKKLQAIVSEIERLTLMPSGHAASRTGNSDFFSHKIALLPAANNTLDLTSHEYVRHKIYDALTERGYRMIPLDEIDEKLRLKGITDGGQLGSLAPKVIAQTLGADRLIYGSLDDFRVVNVGIYFKRQVRVSLRMTDSNGAALWQNTAQCVRQTLYKPQEAGQAFIVNLVKTQAQKIVKSYLKDESDEAALRTIETLPQRKLTGR